MGTIKEGCNNFIGANLYGREVAKALQSKLREYDPEATAEIDIYHNLQISFEGTVEIENGHFLIGLDGKNYRHKAEICL